MVFRIRAVYPGPIRKWCQPSSSARVAALKEGLQASGIGVARELGLGDSRQLGGSRERQPPTSVRVESAVDLDLAQPPLEELDEEILAQRLELLDQVVREYEGQRLSRHVYVREQRRWMRFDETGARGRRL